VKEAEACAAEDKKMKEAIEIRNNADQMVYQTEKLMNEAGDKLDENDKAGVNAELEVLKEALKGTDTDAIKNATEAVQKKVYDLSSKIYAQAQSAGADPGAAGFDPNAAAGGANADGVYDADFKDVEDK